MNIEFNKVSEFNRGTIFELLTDAYSFDYRCAQRWSSDWKEFDNFFFDNLQIADKYGFITTLNNEAIGIFLIILKLAIIVLYQNIKIMDMGKYNSKKLIEELF